MKRGKNYLNSLKKIDRNVVYEPKQAIDEVKKACYAKFDETIDVVMNLHLEKKHSIRGTLIFDHSFGKTKRVLVFAEGDAAAEAKEAGAEFIGSQDLIDKIAGGWMDFDICIATPDMMKNVGKIAKVLGPKGLMPNPKVGTVTTEMKKAIEEIKKGKVEYRADKTGNVHLGIGKKSMDSSQLYNNFMILYREILKRKPTDLKGDYIRKIYLSSTMGPSVKIDLAQIR